MTATGLVLGGGGVVGIAWEVGVLAGLEAAGGFVATDAAAVVGTSAGSVVGASVALGRRGTELVAGQRHTTGGRARGALGQMDLSAMARLFQVWTDTSVPDAERRRAVIDLALAATTPDEATWLEGFANFADQEWPDTPYMATAVACDTGKLTVWSKASGVPLQLAVASSCTVPGLFPPVTIEGRRYVDGGLHSASNADLLIGTGVDRAIFIGPIAGGPGLGEMAAKQLERERAALESAGIPLTVITPGPEFAPLLVSLMDPSKREEGLAIGEADGRRAAAALATSGR